MVNEANSIRQNRFTKPLSMNFAIGLRGESDSIVPRQKTHTLMRNLWLKSVPV